MSSTEWHLSAWQLTVEPTPRLDPNSCKTDGRSSSHSSNDHLCRGEKERERERERETSTIPVSGRAEFKACVVDGSFNSATT